MQRVLKNIFFKDDKIENNLKFWVLIGPFFLFLSIILATFKLAIFAAVALFLCYRFRFKGLTLALLSLVVYSFYMQVNLEEKHLWYLGLQMSIALGLVISTCSFDEIKNYLSLYADNKHQDLSVLQKQFKEQQTQLDASKKNLEENLVVLKGELDKKTQKIVQITQESENLKKDLQDNVQRKDYLLNELDSKVKEIDQLHIKQDELFEKLSHLKDEEFLLEKNKNFQKEIEELKGNYQKEKEKISKELEDKNKKIEQLLQNSNQTQNFEEFKRKLKEKEKEIVSLKDKLKTKPNINLENITDSELAKEYKDKMEAFKHINSLYQQLRKQFEDKQNILHKTRQELFHVKERLTAQQRQKEEFEEINDFERTLLTDLDQAIEDLQRYTKENQVLEEVISSLVNKEENSDIE